MKINQNYDPNKLDKTNSKNHNNTNDDDYVNNKALADLDHSEDGDSKPLLANSSNHSTAPSINKRANGKYGVDDSNSDGIVNEESVTLINNHDSNA